jgi:hypothetical protein
MLHRSAATASPAPAPEPIARRPEKQLYGMDQRHTFAYLRIATAHSCSIRPEYAHTIATSRRTASPQIPIAQLHY